MFGHKVGWEDDMFGQSEEDVRKENEVIRPIPDDVGLSGPTRMGGSDVRPYKRWEV